jgi:hypothetical protein
MQFVRKTPDSSGVKYKVTPAGRYTVSPVFEPQYGMVLEINENQGPDWSLAIHQVALWNKSQRRDARLRSANDEDKHITDGCVDVDAATIRQLLRYSSRVITHPRCIAGLALGA